MAVPGNFTIHTDHRSPFLTQAYVMAALSTGNALSDAHSELDIFPGFCDVHVHLREPGFSYKETIASGTKACARGGYTTVCAMPNLNPVPDSLEHLNVQLDRIRSTAAVRVLPYGSITVGEKGAELADLEALAPDVVAFSDDGKGLEDPALMEEAMRRAKALGKPIVAHCEDMSLVRGGYIHDGAYARAHGHAGICSESEWKPIARDLELCAKTGCSYQVCHISCKESVDLIRQAKADGLDVTCETAPHYLLLDESCLKEEGRFKMNPPIREARDREALVEGLRDGTVDMVATDHAPHTPEEKSRGLKDSPFGISGIETAFPLLYTGLVRTEAISLPQLLERMIYTPLKRFRIDPVPGFSVWDLHTLTHIDSERFLSMGKATPFDGQEVYGTCLATFLGDQRIW